MSRFKLHRRTMLRGSLAGAAVAIGLPMLDLFRDSAPKAHAAPGSMKYFGVFFWGNGNIPSRWTPTITGTGWEMTEQLAPLAAHRDKFSVVSNLAVKTTNAVAHESGASGIFTGASLLETPQGFTFAGPSIDQRIADVLGTTTPYRSIETSCENGESWSFRGPHARNTAISSPATLFANVFGGGIMSGGGGDTTGLALRVSVLDAVIADANRLRVRLGVDDRRRLDQHLTGIRELEKRLAPRDPNLPPPVCDFPAEPLADYPDINGRAQLSAKSRAFVDILVHAVQCEQVRVFSHWLTRSVTDLLFQSTPSVSIVDGHHRLTHDEAGDQPMVHECVKQVMAELAYMIEAFDAVPDPDGGSLLDHMTLLATSDCSLGRQHRLDEFPIILAGGGGGFRMGEHIRLPTPENASRLQLALLQAADLSIASFGGDDGFTTEPLTEIKV